MSGFDGMMRSQAQVAQERAGYDAQRYRSMEGIGQAAMQAPGMMIDAYRGVQQIQQAEQQMMMLQRDADMRLALQQQEFQSNAQKLQAMAAIDETDIRFQALRSAKLQNEAMEFELSEQKKRAETRMNPADEIMLKVWQSSPQTMLDLDYVVQPDGRVVKDPAQAKSARDAQAKSMTEYQRANAAMRGEDIDIKRRGIVVDLLAKIGDAFTRDDVLPGLMEELRQLAPTTYDAIQNGELDPKLSASMRARAERATATGQPARRSPTAWPPDAPPEVIEAFEQAYASPDLDELLKSQGLTREDLDRVLRNPNSQQWHYTVQTILSRAKR